MSNTVSTEATLFSTTHPDVVKTYQYFFCYHIRYPLRDRCRCICNLFKDGGFLIHHEYGVYGWWNHFVLWAVFRLFWRSKEWVYAPTGSVAKEGACFFDVCDLQALTETLEKKGFETKNDVKVKTNGNVRMDYMISQDKKFVAAQLFRFIPYTYEPASSVFYFTGDDASAFVHCLETSEF